MRCLRLVLEEGAAELHDITGDRDRCPTNSPNESHPGPDRSQRGPIRSNTRGKRLRNATWADLCHQVFVMTLVADERDRHQIDQQRQPAVHDPGNHYRPCELFA